MTVPNSERLALLIIFFTFILVGVILLCGTENIYQLAVE
jgi:hypothetical protein